MKHEKYSFGYDALRVWARWLHRMIHKRITVAGLENIPKDKPVIFAPNHQNALMDAMAVLLTTKHQPTWLARADIFKNRFVSRILYFLKMSPVYRIRDGKESLGKNDEVFDLSIRVLKNNKSLAVFPEAQHSFKRQSLPHKKAVPRIAFMAEEREEFNLDIHIIPVGLYYDHYYRFNRELMVNYGDPIQVKEFEDQYRENPGAANIALRKEIYNRLVPLTIHIKSREHYPEYETLREIYRNDLPGKIKPQERLELEKAFIRKVENFEKKSPDEARKLFELAENYGQKLDHIDVEDKGAGKIWTTLRAIWNTFLSGISLPVFLYGWLNFFLGFHLPSILIRKKIKDRVFWATVEYVAWIIFIPMFLLIQWGVFWAVSGSFLYSIIYLLTLPFFGKLALNLNDFYRKTIQQIRLVSAGKKTRFQIKRLREDILTLIGHFS